MQPSWRATLSLAVLTLAACAPATGSKGATSGGPGAVAPANRAAGVGIFKMNCAVCHGPAGAGGVVGPSLRHESERMDFGETISWIEDPEPPMPHLYPKTLTKSEVRDVAAYVESL